jgi:hypothetical protein
MEVRKIAMATLNKSEAASYLHQEYSAYIHHHALEDQHPDFHSIISENVRTFNAPSAVKAGYPRGNHAKFGKLEFVRKTGGKPYFSRSDLQAFFHLLYVPKMLKTSLSTVVITKPYYTIVPAKPKYEMVAVSDQELDRLLADIDTPDPLDELLSDLE